MSWIEAVAARNLEPPALLLPERYRQADRRNIPEGALQNCVSQYLRQFYEVAPLGIGCLFLGRARTYKTFAACSIAIAVNQILRLDVEFVQCALWFGQIDRNRFSPQSDRKLRTLYDASLVVMDDFAQVTERGYAAGLLMEIAEARFANQRPTIWTGNVEILNNAGNEQDWLDVLARLYGPGFARRVFDGSKGFRVRIT